MSIFDEIKLPQDITETRPPAVPGKDYILIVMDIERADWRNGTPAARITFSTDGSRNGKPSGSRVICNFRLDGTGKRSILSFLRVTKLDLSDPSEEKLIGQRVLADIVVQQVRTETYVNAFNFRPVE